MAACRCASHTVDHSLSKGVKLKMEYIRFFFAEISSSLKEIGCFSPTGSVVGFCTADHILKFDYQLRAMLLKPDSK